MIIQCTLLPSLLNHRKVYLIIQCHIITKWKKIYEINKKYAEQMCMDLRFSYNVSSDHNVLYFINTFQNLCMHLYDRRYVSIYWRVKLSWLYHILFIFYKTLLNIMGLHCKKIVYWNEEDTEIKFFPTRLNVNIKHECRANITEPSPKTRAIHV